MSGQVKWTVHGHDIAFYIEDRWDGEARGMPKGMLGQIG
jgi:hypothetical protein